MGKPPPLPIDAVLPELLAALASCQSAVLVAPTGAGKTTRVPPALLGADGLVILCEPRRLAARAAARRIADELGVRLGEEVGYQVRFDARWGPRTRILVVTDGILLRRLQEDPFLEGVSAVVLDEVHERGLLLDLVLAMTRRVQADARPELQIVAMSATVDPGPLAAFLGGCPVVRSEGRLFPVELHYEPRTDERPLPARVRGAVVRALAQTDGDVLVFLPGVREIRRCEEALEGVAAEVLPLFGDLPPEAQDAALRPGAGRRVVLATNVAESSVTLPGVTAVVDAGLARRASFDPSAGLDRLDVVRIAADSADQRSGRAGRLRPGVAWRLWTEVEHRRLSPRTSPEVARVDVCGALLQLAAWGEPLRDFPWFEAPSQARIAVAVGLLQRLGALDGEHITALGRELAKLPVHPRLGRLLLAAVDFGAAEHGALAAALLSERDVFAGRDEPTWCSTSDLLDRIDAVQRGGRGARGVRQVADQLLRLLPRGGRAGNPEQGLARALLAAWPDRLAHRRAPGSDRALMVDGAGVRLSPRSAVREAEWFVAVDVAGGVGAEALVHIASAVDDAWLPPVERVMEARLDGERVVGREVSRRAGIDLSERAAPVEPLAAERLLIAFVRKDPAAALQLDDPAVAEWLARRELALVHLPELGLAPLDDDWWSALAEGLCAGRRSLAELRGRRLLDALEGSLTWPQRQALRDDVPERIAVPSGDHVALEYRRGEPPVLAVRMQQLFGLAQTPTIARGRVRVRLHLLAPNRRPQQITDDLAGFWARTWPEVRKELRARYPKHAWPDDPLTAQALRGTKRQG